MNKHFAKLLYLIGIFLILFYFSLDISKSFNLSTIARPILLLSSCLLFHIGGIFISKHNKNEKAMKLNLWIYFILYLTLILTLTLFDPMWGRNGLELFNWNSHDFEVYINNSFNIIPFKTIYLYIRDLFNLTLPTVNIFYNLFGNLVCMMPLGFFLPLLFKKLEKPKNFIITVLLFSLSIEIIQFLTISGSCDIDDIILNTLGAFIMFKVINTKVIKKLIGNIFFLEKNKINSEEVYKVLRVFVAIIILLLVSMKTRDTFYEKEINKNMYSLEIIDTTEVCAEALESFYEDSKYIYYFSCMKSNNVYAKINGKKYLVKDLLNNNPTKYNITIDILEEFGLEFIKEEK